MREKSWRKVNHNGGQDVLVEVTEVGTTMAGGEGRRQSTTAACALGTGSGRAVGRERGCDSQSITLDHLLPKSISTVPFRPHVQAM